MLRRGAMVKRDVVLAALAGEAPPYVPWSMGFTVEAAEKLQAFYAPILSVRLQAPLCTAFIAWGFTDRYSWIPMSGPGKGRALIFDADYAAKPADDALRLAFGPAR